MQEIMVNNNKRNNSLESQRKVTLTNGIISKASKENISKIEGLIRYTYIYIVK